VRCTDQDLTLQPDPATTRAVFEEVVAKPEGDRTLETVHAIASFAIVDDEVPSPEILSWDLGAGETQVIAHAVAHGFD
jgi:hypothetical protein